MILFFALYKYAYLLTYLLASRDSFLQPMQTHDARATAQPGRLSNATTLPAGLNKEYQSCKAKNREMAERRPATSAARVFDDANLASVHLRVVQLGDGILHVPERRKLRNPVTQRRQLWH